MPWDGPIRLEVTVEIKKKKTSGSSSSSTLVGHRVDSAAGPPEVAEAVAIALKAIPVPGSSRRRVVWCLFMIRFATNPAYFQPANSMECAMGTKETAVVPNALRKCLMSLPQDFLFAL